MTENIPIFRKHVISCKQGAVKAVRFNDDGNYCLTAGSDKSIKLWNPYTKRLLQSYLGHGYEVLDVQSSCDNAHIASGGKDKCVIYWDVSTSQVVRKFRGHSGQINAIKFNEESTVILSASLDNTLCTWDCRSHNKEPIQILKDAKDSVTSIAVSNYEILSTSLDCKLRRYDLRKGELNEDDLNCPLTCVNFTKDGQCVLVSCLNDSLCLINKDDGQVLAEYLGHKNTDYQVESCVSNSNNEIVSGSEDGHIYFWDLIRGTFKEKLMIETKKVIPSISFHPSKPILLAAAQGNIYLWTTQEEEIEKSE